MADRDPYDVVGVLRRLTHRLTTALAPMAWDDWRCLRVLPRIDGTAALVISGPQGESTYNWVAPTAQSEPLDTDAANWHWGQLLPPETADDPQVTRQVTSLLSATLSRTLAHPSFAVLRWCNRHLAGLRFDDAVVDVLLADRLAPDRTRWFDHVFHEAFQSQSDRFHLVFTGPHGDVQFCVAAPGAARGAEMADGEPLLEHRLFQLWLTEDPRPSDTRQQVRSQVERFVGFLLSRATHPSMILQADAGASAGGSAVDTQGRDGATATSWLGAPVSTSRWANVLQWHQFFSDFEISRSELCNVQFNEPVAYVIHGEPECCVVEPRIRPGAHTYARMPFRRAPAKRGAPAKAGPKLYLSLITERETVLGGDSSLDDALDRAAKDPHTQLIHINNTCLPKMVGDDLDSLVARLAERTDKAILNLNTDLSSPDASYRHMLAQAERHGAHPADDIEIPPGSVSFLGFARGPHRRELRLLLRALGIEVAAFLVPELDVQQTAHYRRGSAQVVYPREAWQRLHAELFADLDTPLLEAPAPYGLADTRRWLEIITEAVGQSAALTERWEELAGAHVKRFEALGAQVGDGRVGAVVTVESAARLYRAERLHGVALLPLLEEMGFGLDVFLLDAEPSTAASVDEAEAGLRGCLQNSEQLSVIRFSSPATLASALAEAPCQAVYSEVACDHRLSQAGKTGFGMDLIEMGLPGAVRSLERLLDLTRWRFYGRYARHLQPRPELAEARPSSNRTKVTDE